MELSEITKVADLSSADELNRYLAIGWKLINTYTSAYDTQYPGCNHQTIHYVIGWSGSDPEYPESRWNIKSANLDPD